MKVVRILSFYRFTGVGRWLLLNLHQLLKAEKVEKANVLLLSGTSWAGETASYHVQAEVTGIPAAPRNEIEAISESQFTFLPQRDEKGELISVSGLQGENRSEALRKMLRGLAKPDEFGNLSHFEETLKNIENENRQRILLAVGSYREVDVVFDQLQNIRSDWKNKIVRLKPDHEEWIDENENVHFWAIWFWEILAACHNKLSNVGNNSSSLLDCIGLFLVSSVLFFRFLFSQ